MAGIVEALKSVDTIYYIWFAAIILFAVLEAVTVQLVSVWFVIGSVAGLVSALLGAPIYLQVIISVVVSIIALLVTRPLVKKHIKTNVIPTNADRIIGKTGVVTEEIDNSKAVGLVKVDGQIWSAKSEYDELLPPDTSVEVLKIEGAKIIVKKA